MPTTRGPSEGDRDSASRGPEAIDVVTIEQTIEMALGVSRGQLQVSTLVDLEAQLRGHIALLREPARKATDRMWQGGTKWYRHITRLDGIERQTEQELNPLPFGALIEVQLMARDCQWLLDGYKENWR
ncbi:DUF6415 family natural product biosynthesis protein [Streptomyces sp. Isolate_219]|uniref:DUF6415 family natural product biosynthesis protein n=1 Tax=Streptomyces sp. Isolate_219 TaxID=2950110 RepID=UPI0021C7C9BA|nr:DUF6415 family natural product biosynthesis protein [Streptomyces sp. Isolate_219]MCR8579199.1 DUF6415 family natural product biosynthesis protein [Streptomyces sp. Isolate_219]